MRGFNYTTAAEFDLPVAQLREDLQTIIDGGGFRRVENGETFAHGSDGRIVWEAYGNVTLKKSGEPEQAALIGAAP
jgi:hypothetical protein